MSKILLLSGSRADFGYLLPLAEALRDAGENAYIEVLHDIIDGEDTPQAIAQRAGLILSAGGKTLAEQQPDMLIVLGDRWEIASACIAAVLARIPIAHIGAGERTAGSYDDRLRGAIEGMASLKFALTRTAYAELRGDCYLAGCTSVQSPAEIVPADGTALVAIYPETNGDMPYSIATDILPVIEERGLDPFLIGSNPDVGYKRFGGDKLPLEEFHKRLASASVIIGNSSAGIIEAPILCTPTVNIGTRQHGRPMAESIFQAEANPESVAAALDKALAFGKRRVVSPYEHEEALQRIVNRCREYLHHR